MKLTRRRALWVVISALILLGVALIALTPSSVEGVYRPFSTFGCDCDQFMEFRGGRVVTYVMESPTSDLDAFYEKDASGATSVRLSASDPEPIIGAEPHFLGTRFFYLSEGKSEWFWRRFVTRKMRDHMVGSKIRDVLFEDDGARTLIYDHKFNVIDTSFRPRPIGSGTGRH